MKITEEIISAYITGNLSADENESFQKQMHRDAALQKRVKDIIAGHTVYTGLLSPGSKYRQSLSQAGITAEDLTDFIIASDNATRHELAAVIARSPDAILDILFLRDTIPISEQLAYNLRSLPVSLHKEVEKIRIAAEQQAKPLQTLAVRIQETGLAIIDSLSSMKMEPALISLRGTGASVSNDALQAAFEYGEDDAKLSVTALITRISDCTVAIEISIDHSPTAAPQDVSLCSLENDTTILNIQSWCPGGHVIFNDITSGDYIIRITDAAGSSLECIIVINSNNVR